MAGQVVANPLFFPNIRIDFWATFKANETQVDARLGKIFNLGTASTQAQEAYGYAQAAPVARFWDEGKSIPTDEFLTNLFLQRNYKFGVGVEIARTSIADDQTKMIMSRVLEAAASFAMLKERHFYWLFTGGTTIDALQMQPQLPNAPDGVGWFSKLDGNGNNRFQVANGNIVASSGVGSPQAIINDFFSAQARIASFRNLQSQPYWNPGDILREAVVIYNSANIQNFVSAFNQTFIVAASGNAAPSNVLKDMGQTKTITQIANPRITNNNWAVGGADAPFKAPFWQEREAPSEVMAELGNSDLSREWDVVKLYVRSRGAIGLGLPVAWCGVQ